VLVRLSLIPVVAALLAGCGGASPPAPGDAPATTTAARDGAPARKPPALCGPLRVRVTGRVSAPGATELSGLAASPDQPGVLWSHNDSGDRARVFALRRDGSLVASLDVPGAQAVDWEDLAIGPDPGSDARHALYLADIGDNDADRASVDVYRVPEPRAAAGATTTAPAVRLALRYPDGPHDAETLLVDPRTGELVIVTKQLSGESRVMVAAQPPAGGTGATPLTMRLAGQVSFGLGGLATAGDVSADGRIVVVRTYTGFLLWRKTPAASLAATLLRRPSCRGRTSFPDERQGEALALDAHGLSFWTVPEGSQPAIRQYAAALR